jgi:hypothetical protein
MDAGVRLAAPTRPAPTVKPATVVYETKSVDTHWRSRPLPPTPLDRGVQILLGGMASGAATGRARFARTVARPPAVTLDPERYVVATTDTLTARPDIATGLTKGAATVALKHAAGLGVGLQVVPSHEVSS